MFAKVNTAGLSGMEGFPVEVEADVQYGLPGFFLTGALSPETREAHWSLVICIVFSPDNVNFNRKGRNLPPFGMYYITGDEVWKAEIAAVLRVVGRRYGF